jgi:hypothetical protein
MTFFKLFMRALASGGAVAATALAKALIEFFGTAVPSDIALPLWTLISMTVIFGLNLVLGKIGK